MNAEDIMVEDVITVSQDTTISDALRVMEEKSIRHLPVVAGSSVVGMLSDRDVRSLGMSLVTDFETMDALQAKLALHVSELMSGDVLTVVRTAELKEVIDLMVDEKVSAVPVVDESSDTLVGIVSYIDVLRGVRDQL